MSRGIEKLEKAAKTLTKILAVSAVGLVVGGVKAIDKIVQKSDRSKKN